MGSNSLRAGVSAEDVISDMKAVKAKCLANGILPVFLTLPPINPVNIQKAFDEPTADNWQDLFAEVNAYIRTQVHIDDAAGMQYDSEVLAAQLQNKVWNDLQMIRVNGSLVGALLGAVIFLIMYGTKGGW